jgi:hypothetical protein
VCAGLAWEAGAGWAVLGRAGPFGLAAPLFFFFFFYIEIGNIYSEVKK